MKTPSGKAQGAASASTAATAVGWACTKSSKSRPKRAGSWRRTPRPANSAHCAKRAGETTLFEEGMIGAGAGQTSLEEVLRVAWAPAEEK